MKCYECNDKLGAEQASYTFNYQDEGTKFYGLMWCQRCGKKVLEALKRQKGTGNAGNKVRVGA